MGKIEANFLRDEHYSKKSISPKKFLSDFILNSNCGLCGNPYVNCITILNDSNPRDAKINILEQRSGGLMQLYTVCRICFRDKIFNLLMEDNREKT